VKIRYHPLARIDVAEIVQYYETEAGLDVAVEFFADLTQSIQFVRHNPYAFPIIGDNIRRCLLLRFPYQINYELLEESTIKILIVKHQSRHPRFGTERS
jgi:plasmid stabilization system protein ParE